MSSFKEKHLNQKLDWDLGFELSAEFISTIIFAISVYLLPLLLLTPGQKGLAVFFSATFVIYTFGRRCGACFNPAIVTGLMCGGKMNLIKGNWSLIFIVSNILFRCSVHCG